MKFQTVKPYACPYGLRANTVLDDSPGCVVNGCGGCLEKRCKDCGDYIELAPEKNNWGKEKPCRTSATSSDNGNLWFVVNVRD